jgi:hypothetical protein
MSRMLRTAWMLLLALTASVTCAAQQTNPTDDATSMPTALGFPISVRASVMYLDLIAVDENAGRFDATIDVRLRWRDPRLAFPAARAPRGFEEHWGDAARGKLEQIWRPSVEIGNLTGEPTFAEHGLRIFTDGQVEWMRRYTAQFASAFDGAKFPFDRQHLDVELVVRHEPIEVVALDFTQGELDASQPTKGLRVEPWTIGVVELRRAPLDGWYRQRHARLVASLAIERQPGHALAVLFVPLFASLLIPLLALWLNRAEDGAFQVEAFELTNIIIGGLFAVVALNFTFNSEHPLLSGSDNTVTQLFGLNYLTLAASLAVTIVLFRFNAARRLFGRHVQQELYACLVWAIPVLVFTAATAVMLVAMA